MTIFEQTQSFYSDLYAEVHGYAPATETLTLGELEHGIDKLLAADVSGDDDLIAEVRATEYA